MTTPAPTPEQTLANRRNQAWFCSKTNGGHAWVYRRTSAGTGTYRCMSCGFTISKHELKQLTDND